jgi:hypothetical protein
LKERSEEVKRMGDIYRRASSVVVWLGQPSSDSSTALGALAYVGSWINVDYRDASFSASRRNEPEWCGGKQALPFNQATWSAIGDLLSRDWFKRVWILQEISLADQASAKVVCGFHEFFWSPMRAAIWYLGLVYNYEIPLETSLARGNLRYANTITQITETSSLIKLLRIVRNGSCADDRDRIYGVMDMAIDAHAMKIQPDYSKGTQEVYTHLALQMMRNMGGLGLELLNDVDSEPLSGTPTWVPNWSKPASSKFFMELHGASAYGIFEYLDPGILKVQGVCCGVVVKCSDVASDKEEAFAFAKELEPLDALTNDYLGGGDILDAFLSALRRLGNDPVSMVLIRY